MTQEEFLEHKLFTDLNSNKEENTNDYYFSEEDFTEILKRTEDFGIAVYDIKTTLDGKTYKTVHHESFRKKATDSKWYNREFKNLKHEQQGLLYTATYKVSKKLLER